VLALAFPIVPLGERLMLMPVLAEEIAIPDFDEERDFAGDPLRWAASSARPVPQRVMRRDFAIREGV
jgi:hypothetical protein